MARTNPQVEALEHTISLLRRQLDERHRDPGDMPVRGCGDNSCLVEKPRGMATNGGCHCSERKLRWSVQWWKRRAAFLEETIRLMKDQGFTEPKEPA